MKMYTLVFEYYSDMIIAVKVYTYVCMSVSYVYVCMFEMWWTIEWYVHQL